MATGRQTLSALIARFCGPAADAAKVLGITAEQMRLLDQGRAVIPPGSFEYTVRRIGHQCKAADVQQALAEAYTNRRVNGTFAQRITRCAEELARRGRRAHKEVLQEHFPDPLERDQVAGPDAKLRLEWKPAVILIDKPTGADRLDS